MPDNSEPHFTDVHLPPTAIIGLGLMGGSLALGLRQHCDKLLAIDINPETVKMALERKIVDVASSEPEGIIDQAEIIILAAPVHAIIEWIQRLPEIKSEPVIIFDLGSTKNQICQALENLPERFDPIGGHPMTGKEVSGLKYAEENLFQDATFALTPLMRSSSRARQIAHTIVEILGGVPIWIDPATHDSWVATTSHLPYILSMGLVMNTAAEAAPLIGPGFRSTSRLAGSDPIVMSDILLTNREIVQREITHFRKLLDTFETELQADDPEAMQKFLAKGQKRFMFLNAKKGYAFMKPLSARVSVPGSKSHTNRALLIAALADGHTCLQNALFADDTLYFAKALTSLGFQVELDQKQSIMTVSGTGGKIPASNGDVFIGNAGTAARFLTAMLTLGHGEYRLDGIARMRQRPIETLVKSLNDLGAQAAAPTCCPPVEIHARGLRGGKTSIRGDVSSQFLSGLLMVAPYAQEEVEINVDGPLNSKPYIDLTLGVMADFGVEIQRQEYARFQVTPQHYQSPESYSIESDASAASYFFAAPAVCGGWVEVSHLTRNARQGDIAFLDILSQMGCSVIETSSGIRVTGPERLRGVNVDMRHISDTSMTLAAIAPFAETPTRISGIASSRLKETDRIAATCAELSRLGVRVDEHQDGMTIYPCADIKPARIHTYDDHRMAMAFALIGLRVPGVEILDPECVSKTFPDYFDVLESMK